VCLINHQQPALVGDEDRRARAVATKLGRRGHAAGSGLVESGRVVRKHRVRSARREMRHVGDVGERALKGVIAVD
tara:strand:- start:40 stop:264 length:225 start_codon:yes stop_codon:yes gene_type:complete